VLNDIFFTRKDLHTCINACMHYMLLAETAFLQGMLLYKWQKMHYEYKVNLNNAEFTMCVHSLPLQKISRIYFNTSSSFRPRSSSSLYTIGYMNVYYFNTTWE